MISRMKRLLLFYLTIFAQLNTNGQSTLQLFSPDKTIRIEIQTFNRLSYSVFVDNKKILDECSIDMKLSDGKSLSEDMKDDKKNFTFCT